MIKAYKKSRPRRGHPTSQPDALGKTLSLSLCMCMPSLRYATPVYGSSLSNIMTGKNLTRAILLDQSNKRRSPSRPAACFLQWPSWEATEAGALLQLPSSLLDPGGQTVAWDTEELLPCWDRSPPPPPLGWVSVRQPFYFQGASCFRHISTGTRGTSFGQPVGLSALEHSTIDEGRGVKNGCLSGQD